MSKDPRYRAPGFPGPSLTRALVAACVVAAMAQAAPAAAQWRPQGAAFDSAATGQNSLRAVSDGRAGFIAAWIDTLTGTPAIRCQRVDSTGAVRWTAGGVLVRANARGFSGLTMAADGRNGALLAWVDSAAAGQAKIRVQRVRADSVVQWGAGGLVADTTIADTLQGSPAIDSDGLGGAIVAWVDRRTVPGDAVDNDEVYVQRVDSTGVRLWTDGGVRTRDDGGDDPNSLPRVLGDGNGGAWVSWQDPAPNARVFVQLFNGSGVPQWLNGGDPLDPSVSTPNGTTDLLMVRVPSTSSLMLAWLAIGGGGSIRGAILSSSGTLGADAQLLGTWNFPPRALLVRGTNAFYLVSASGTEVRGMTITSGGTVTGVPLAIATEPALDASSNVSAVSDGSGGVHVTWASAGVARARHIVSAGTSDWGPTPLTSGVTPSQSFPVPVPGADLLVAWIDGRNAATGPDLYAQRVSPSGVTAPYFRIFATVAGGNGTFSAGGGRTWVPLDGTLAVRFTGTGGHHVDSALVGATILRAVPNYTFRNVRGDSTLQAFFSNAPIVTQAAMAANAYRAFSVPATLSPATVSSLFANLLPYDPVRWRLGHWEADDSTYLDPASTPALSSIVPGAGYWFIGLKDTTLAFSGTAVAETQFNLPMLGGPVSGRGWTQFGSPFRFPFAVSQLRTSLLPNAPITDPANTFTDPQVLEWNPATSSYGAVSVLHPGRVYWLWRQSAAAVTLRFPFEWDPAATAGLEPSLATLGDWAVNVTARAGAREANLVLGAAPVGAGSWNRLSAHAPPASPGESVSLVARVSDWGEDSGEYASVFRPDAATLSWDFDASVTRGLAETALTFEFTNLPAGRRVLLSEPAAGWSREIAHGEPVALALSGIARRLRLEVLADGPVTPTPRATALRAAGPNPFRESASLAFSIARSGPLRWDVFDLAGRRVVSGSRAVEAGEHVVTWDGRDDAGRRVEPGLYLLRWQADGRTGTARLVRTD